MYLFQRDVKWDGKGVQIVKLWHNILINEIVSDCWKTK